MKDTDKELLALLFIGSFVSFLFYYINLGCVYTLRDFIWLLFGISFPFVIVVGIHIKNILEVPSYVWGF